MNEKAQRIAIAEACGFKRVNRTYYIDPDGLPRTTVCADALNLLPDYLHDLNAMHEAEKVLNKEKGGDYAATLFDISLEGLIPTKRDEDAWFFHVRATATQRAEAFLRTLGLWVEDE